MMEIRGCWNCGGENLESFKTLKPDGFYQPELPICGSCVWVLITKLSGNLARLIEVTETFHRKETGGYKEDELPMDFTDRILDAVEAFNSDPFGDHFGSESLFDLDEEGEG